MMMSRGRKNSSKALPYPILEFDPSRKAQIEPTDVIQPGKVSEYCVVCFFREVIENVAAEKNARVVATPRWEDGPHPIYEISHNERRLAFFHPGVGAPLAAGLLEDAVAVGCAKFIVCGGCGVLEPEMPLGELIIVSGAIRDEGVSYHYLPPGREVKAQTAGVAALEETLKRHGLQYQVGKTWTTDAPYRETALKIAARRKEGCLTVEMEAAGLMAVAAHRGVLLGQVLYGGDDLSGERWEHRDWWSQNEVRESLFWLAAEACLSL
jgi:uridine phosphorylase